jgi:AcrR family transcriptional regulator
MASSSPSQTANPSSTRSQRSARTRDKVLAVATELMARQGYSGTTISAISKASGVMPASIYWHFESKEGLLAAVIERAAEAWFEGAAQAAGGPDAAPLGADEHKQGLRYIFEERPDFYRVLMLIGLERGQAGGPPVEAVKRVRERLREKLVERLSEALVLEGQTLPGLPESLADYAMLLLDGLFFTQQIDPLEGDALETRYDLLPTVMRALRVAFVSEAQASDASGEPGGDS